MIKKILFMLAFTSNVFAAENRTWTYICCNQDGEKVAIETKELPAFLNCKFLSTDYARQKCASYYLDPGYIGLQRQLKRDLYYPENI